MNENIKLPSKQKFYMPKRKLMTRFDWWILFIVILFGASFLIHIFVEPETARAQTITLQHCRTNLECERIYCSGEAMNYVQDSALTQLCKHLPKEE